MTISLKATPRAKGENLTALRKTGSIPAVVYGAGQTTASILVGLKDFQKAWQTAGESGSIVLELPDKKIDVLIHEIANDPVRGIPAHVDFRAIDINKPIEANVPVEFTGVAPAVKNGLGVLVKVVHEIEVRGLSKDIPHTLEVDVSTLETLENQIMVKDIKLPKGVEALANEDDVVASIASIQEESAEPATAIDFTQIEVEKKGKKEEEAAETSE